MRVNTAPLMAILLLSGGVAGLPAAWSQGLPPVVMGKTVKQPGDNQYMPQAQLDRHANYIDRTGTNSSIFISRPHAGGGGGGGMIQAGGATINPMNLMYSTSPKVDVSLEPISTDEPVPPAGFPPLPDRIQLPVSMATSGAGSGAGSAGWNGGGGGAGSGNSGVQRSGSGFEGIHQHYVHMAPGSYLHGGGGGGGGSGGGGYAADPGAAVPGYTASRIGGATVNGGGGSTGSGGQVLPQHGYYKVGSAPSPSVALNHGDTFNANTGSGGVPGYAGATSKDLKAMGPAPKLDDGQDAQAGAPEAPQAAIVSQSQAQDLSLPDDEFVSRQGLQDSAGKRAAKRAAQRMGQIILQGVNMGVSRVYSAVP